MVAVLSAGDAGPGNIVRMNWYVTDIDEYLGRVTEVGQAYREVIGKNFPAMTLLGVAALADRRAKVEIDATAVVPSD